MLGSTGAAKRSPSLCRHFIRKRPKPWIASYPKPTKSFNGRGLRFRYPCRTPTLKSPEPQVRKPVKGIPQRSSKATWPRRPKHRYQHRQRSEELRPTSRERPTSKDRPTSKESQRSGSSSKTSGLSWQGAGERRCIFYVLLRCLSGCDNVEALRLKLPVS